MFAAATKTGSQPSAAANYIEDVFSTYLYTGNASTQTITNGIDLSTKGGLVWFKCRSVAVENCLMDTVQGTGQYLVSNSTASAQPDSTILTSYNSNGFSIGSNNRSNYNNGTFASWTFRKQPKFFDIVTYTGNGVSTGRTISHNLGSTPGMMILKVTDLAGDDWYVYHRSIPTSVLGLNLTNGTSSPPTTPSTVFGNGTTTVAPTSTQFTIGGTANANGYTYVAYLFAHDAGGFGTSGTDNVISCGTFTTTAGGAIPTVTLGYEPQYLMFKCSSAAGNWNVIDNMRGFSQTQTLELFSNAATAETDYGIAAKPTATGFTSGDEVLAGSATFIYMAIRRPMAVPTDATTVFKPVLGTNTNPSFVTSFPVDLNIAKTPSAAGDNYLSSRLQGNGKYLVTNTTAAEATSASLKYDYQNGCNTSAFDGYMGWNFSRRPGFFDEVCYAGQASNDQVINHNLTVPPELIISKARNSANEWWVYSATQSRNKYGYFNNSGAFGTSANIWGTSNPTATTYNINSNGFGDAAGVNVVAYLFATVAGVSKVGSYTGTGATQTINCGFTGGARFVLIKRTDSAGDWWVWDTVRGMVAGTDPKLALNSTSAETNANWVYTTTTGFQIVTTDASVNTSGGNYIYLAIA